MRRAVTWCVANAVFAACLWAGYVEGVEGARNLAVFVIWFSFVGSLTTVNGEVAARCRAKGPPVPMALDLAFDLAVMGFLAWQGSWVLAIVYFLHTAFLHGAYEPKTVQP